MKVDVNEQTWQTTQMASESARTKRRAGQVDVAVLQHNGTQNTSGPLPGFISKETLPPGSAQASADASPQVWTLANR